MRGVTVVVPVYGDLESLEACVASLIEHLDQSIHQVLMVNDVGPDADLIEEALLRQIAGHPAFRYERNPENLGFVGNCNRAVLELDDTDNDILLLNSDTLTTSGFLDELLEVLYSDERHGAVCPRSNNATVASLPFALRNPAAGRPIERTAAVHGALSAILPRFSVSPVAMGFCLLIRRDLIRRFGLFDEAFAPGYGEENDFCLRIGRAGYLSLIAHRTVVYHQGARSFQGARREALRSAHEKLVVSRYPEYTEAVRRYIYQDRDPVDVFADSLVPSDAITRVLVDVGVTPHLDTGDIQLINRLSERPDVAVTVAGPGRQLRQLRRLIPGTVMLRADHVNGIWDAGIALGPADARQRARLNRTCLRIISMTGRPDIPAAITASTSTEGDLAEQARREVDIDALRDRWQSLTKEPGYLETAGQPREPFVRRALRRAELTAPRPVGYAKAVVRRAMGRAQR